MNDISEILRALTDRYNSVAKVEDAFAEMLNSNEELLADYVEWCESNGYATKTGYIEFIEELQESLGSVWDEMNE